VPDVEGVPARTPVEEFKLNPAGSAPLLMDQVMGPVPEAVSICE
jgi:hypothetical protein